MREPRALTVSFLNPEPKYGDGFHQGVQLAVLGQSMSDSKLQAIMGRMYCKDYVTDLFWSENTKQEGSSCGFSWKPGKYNATARWHRISITAGADVNGIKGEYINGGSGYKVTVTKYIDVDLWAPQANLQAFLNAVEGRFGFRKSRVFRACGSKKQHSLVVRFSVDWTDRPVKVSLLTLFLRVGLSFKPGDDVIDHITNISKKGNLPYCPMDAYLCQVLLKKEFPAAFKSGKLPVLKTYSDLLSMGEAHSGGCVGGLKKYI